MVKPDSDTDNPRWQRRPTERRREILEAAAEVFGENGYDCATIAEVAGRAGVSSGTVLNYFGSKGDLFEATLAERFLTVVVESEALTATHQGSYRELLHAILARKWRLLTDSATADLILFGLVKAKTFPEATGLMCREIGQRYRRLVMGALAAGVRSGEFRPLDPEVQARLLGAGLAGLMLEAKHFSRFDASSPDAETLFAQFLASVDHALAAPGAVSLGEGL